jgi:phosphatidylinositol glycan class B
MKFKHAILLVALIWYAITAYFSVGYYHADEHYQIIEFAGSIDGSNTEQELAWEYGAKIRPALQPVICNLVFKGCELFSITDPHSKAFVLRLITGLFAVLAIYYFTDSCKAQIHEKYRKLFLVLSYFVWFLPFINVRFSSETWSGLFLLLSLGIILRDKTGIKSFITLGILLGLGFLFRFQVAFAILGILLWLIIVKKVSLPKIAAITASGLLIVILGIVIDSWFYGNLTVTLLNYFKVNLIEGKAAEFGTSPWYHYLFYVFRYSFFPFGILIILSFLLLVFKRFNHLIVWATLLFIVGHSVISHKELRFLFPLVNLVPVIIILGIQELPSPAKNNTLRKSVIGTSILLLALNVLLLFVASVKPAGVSRVRMMQKIEELTDEKPCTLYFVQGSNPYAPWDITTNFYDHSNLEFQELDPLKPAEFVKEEGKRNILVVEMQDANDPAITDLIDMMEMKERGRSVQNYLIPLLDLYGYKTRNILILYSDE